MKKKHKYNTIINQLLKPYQITLEEIHEEYGPDMKIDGVDWYMYFYVPEEVEKKIIIKHTINSLITLYLPTNIKNNWQIEEILKKNTFLWVNREKLIKAAYGV
jgi:hypothetical protein